MRKKIVAGNWKMNTPPNGVNTLVNNIVEGLNTYKTEDLENTLVIVAPSHPYLGVIADKVKSCPNLKLAAQNCHHEVKGAYTGEVAISMLKSMGVEYVIIGHSERRKYFEETNEMLTKKVKLSLNENLTPIFCCGEPLEIRKKETHISFVIQQLEESLYSQLEAADFEQLVIAYEPIWAIGTGEVATPEQAQEMCLAIRQSIVKKYGNKIAMNTTILYGGSCNPQNAPQLFTLPDIDGGLIGGASLTSSKFLPIVEAL